MTNAQTLPLITKEMFNCMGVSMYERFDGRGRGEFNVYVDGSMYTTVFYESFQQRAVELTIALRDAALLVEQAIDN